MTSRTRMPVAITAQPRINRPCPIAPSTCSATSSASRRSAAIRPPSSRFHHMSSVCQAGKAVNVSARECDKDRELVRQEFHALREWRVTNSPHYLRHFMARF